MLGAFPRRTRTPLPPPPPFPDPDDIFNHPVTSLPSFIQSLALPSSYNLSTPSTRSLLKLALYSFALSPTSPHLPLFFSSPSAHPTSINDDWTLTSVQDATVGGEYSRSRRGKVCGHVFKAGESVYRCRDCSLDATCVLCAKCYHGSRHAREKHDVTMSIHAGVGAGCCDCGDIEAFKDGRDGECRYHSLKMAGEEDQMGQSEEVERLKKDVKATLSVLLDWMVGVLDDSPEEMVPPKSVEDIIEAFHRSSGASTAPPAATEDDVATPLFRPSPLLPLPPTLSSASSSASTSPTSSFDPFTSTSGTSSHVASPLVDSTASMLIDNDPSRASSPPTYISSTTSRGKARASSPSPSRPPPPEPAGPWSVILWNDEKHSFAQVIDQVCRATGVSKQAAGQVAQRVDIHGRDVIHISSDPTQLVAVAKLISAIQLAVTVRSSRDTFYEQVAGEVVKFMKDLCLTKVGGEGGVLSEVLSEVMLEEYGKEGKSRFQKLVGVDARLWKEARKGLAEVYVTLLGVSQEVKMALSVQFAQVYSTVAEAYLLTDREPENSIIFFGVQVFTVPSVSAYLVSSHSFLSHIVSILYSFFTEQLDPTSRGKHLVLPPNPSIRYIDPDSPSPSFKEKRYFQVFSDLNHLLSSSLVQQLLCSTPTLLEDVSAFLDLFTSMNPNVRAINTHVEYESDTWVTAFNVTIQLGKICRTYGEAFKLGTTYQLANGISTLLTRMGTNKGTTNYHQVEFGGGVWRLIKFEVSKQPVSFHHPLAWLLAEMVKCVDLLDEVKLKEVGVVGGLKDVVLGRQGQLAFLASLDHPLRVVVLVAQIRAGLWVRNGFGMRAQQLHYKEYSLRENTFDQDILFLQMALVVLDPSLVFVAILDRFELLNWLTSTEPEADDEESQTYEAGQAIAMAEELLYLLIVLLSDATYIAGQSSETILRRELVHNLCLGPSPYSELMRRVSERFADDPQLDRILGEVSTFKQPVGTADQGNYTLKAECYNEVNPYFSRYSRNQREEADKIVREQLKKANPSSTGEPVIVPTRLDISYGPFKTLPEAFKSTILHRIIFYSLKNGQGRGSTTFSEVVVDEALHLSMLCLLEQPEAFATFVVAPSPTEDGLALPDADEPATPLHLFVSLEEDDRMKSVRHKVQWVLDRLHQTIGGDVVTKLRKVEDTTSPAAALDAKRLAAKARQEAIMKQFAAAQQSFLTSAENFSDEEDEDEDDLANAAGGDEDVGMDGTTTTAPSKSIGTCIVCQDELNASRPFGSLTFVQTSNIIRQTPSGDNFAFQDEVLSTPSSLDHDASSIRPFGISSVRIPVHPDDETGDGVSFGFPQSTSSGLYASACGHMMHLACFETYHKSIEQRHHIQPTRCHPENTERREFICPLCKSLGNVLLPATVEGEGFEVEDGGEDGHDLASWTTLAIDPRKAATEQGVPLVAVDEMVDKARRLQVRTMEGKMGLKPWRISMMLPSTMPGEFLDGEPLMTARLLLVLDPLMQELEGGVSNDAKVAFLPNELIGYTVSAMEVAARGSGDTIQSSVTEATCRMLKSFLLVLANLVHVQTGSGSSSELAAMAVLSHLGGLFSLDNQRALDIFALDPLATVIESAAVMPSAFYHVVAFAYYTHLVQTFFSINRLLEESTSVVEFKSDGVDSSASNEYSALAQIRHHFVSPNQHAAPTSTHGGSNSGINSDAAQATLGKLLYAYTLPFLRRVAIIHRVLFGPSSTVASPSSTPDSEYSRLLTLLRIPPPSQVLAPSEKPSILAIQAHLSALRETIPTWKALISPSSPLLDPSTSLPFSLPYSLLSLATPLEHPTLYELVGLPQQLDTLIAESLKRKCENCQQVPENPALCLICGTMVCNMSFCCMDGEEEAKHGECNLHMWTCGGSVGIFFLVKRNSILYLYTDKGTFTTPPYLDSHGEVDLGGRRGRNQFPQFLHPGRYDEVRKAWLNHGVPTFVARKLDAATDHGGWETM